MRDILVGKYFHSFTQDKDGKVVIEWQGRILGALKPFHYLVETYDWVAGDLHSKFVVDAMCISTPVHVPKPWYIYDTAEEMKASEAHGAAAPYSIRARLKRVRLADKAH